METEQSGNYGSIEVVETEPSRAGRIAKNVGKVALTILSPPIGLATLIKNKSTAVPLGVGICLGFSLGNVYNRNEIYDSPKIETFSYIGSSRKRLGEYILGSFASPLLNYSSTTRVTSLIDENQNEYVIRGKDVVTFNQESGQYVLNFPRDREFVSESEGRLVSLAEAEQRNWELAGRLEELTSSGDILGAREISAKLAETRGDFVELEKEYGLMKETYEGAVEKMNAELNGFAPFPEERQ